MSRSPSATDRRTATGTEPADGDASATVGRDGGETTWASVTGRGSGDRSRRRYRVGVVALGVLGVAMALVGVAFPGTRTLLFALSGVGLFGAVLLYVLVPERFVTATLARRTYAPLAEVGPLLVDGAGLGERRLYVPDREGVRLVVPATTADGRTTPETRGDDVSKMTLPTTGDGLLAEFHDYGHGPLASDPEELLDQLLDALVYEFELVERARGRASPDTKQATVAIEDSHYGPPTTFDHPVAAFLAAGLAAGLETPIALGAPSRDGNDEYVIEFDWHEPTVPADDRPDGEPIDWEFVASADRTEDPAGKRADTDPKPDG